MKFFLSSLILLLFFSVSVYAGETNDKLVINSNNLIEYLKDNHKLNNVSYVCNENVCSKKMVGNKELAINEFLDEYVASIKKDFLDDGISLELKGFKITKIGYY